MTDTAKREEWEIQGETLVRYHGTASAAAIPASVTTLGTWAFEDCGDLERLKLPPTLTHIGWGAFRGCTALREVHIEDLAAFLRLRFDDPTANPLHEGARLFVGGEPVTHLSVPPEITEIRDYALFGFCELERLRLPSGIRTIGDRAFFDCTGLRAVHIEDLAAFLRLRFYDATANPLFCAHRLVVGGEDVTHLVIPEEVTAIRDYAFSGGAGIMSITLPPTLTAIGIQAFLGCCGIRELTLPPALVKLGAWAFSGCTSLRALSLPETLTEIGARAFEGCTALRTLTVPPSVVFIGRGAFEGCTALRDVTLPHALRETAEEIFGARHSEIEFHDI